MPSSVPKSPAGKRKQKGAAASPAPKTPAKPWLQAPASSPSPSSAVVITPVHSKTKPIVSPRRPPGSRGRILAKLAKEGTSGLAEASRRQRLAQMSEHKYYQVRYNYSTTTTSLLRCCTPAAATAPRNGLRRCAGALVTTTTLAN